MAAVRGNTSGPGVIGHMRGISLGGPVSINGDSTFGRSLQVGVVENFVDGSPSAPCLQLSIPGFWRFRWSVKPGDRTIRVSARQAANLAPRPSMVVTANPSAGIPTDLTATAASSTGWVTIGPITFTATAAGVVWVELHNNCVSLYDTPALFDHIIAT